MVQLKDLVEVMPGAKTIGELSGAITGLSYDSRKVEPGFLFVCIEGYKTDGHAYVASALDRGAAAIVAQKEVAVPEGIPLIIVPETRQALALLSAEFYNQPSAKITMVGVTGTNGKTTTTYLIEAILKRHGHKVGLVGTISNKINDKVLPVSNTTPESLDLAKLLAEMVDQGVTYGVMEVSSHALDLQRTAGTEFDIAIFTNITQDHLDFHENMENYLRAKAKLFEGLNPKGVKRHPKYAIINIDDPNSGYLIEKSKGIIYTYGINGSADVKAVNIKLSAKGVSFDVISFAGNLHLNMQLTGMFNVYNTLAALTVGLVKGFPLASLKGALEDVKGVPGRFELVDCGQEYTVIVDYAHTPDSLENVLKTAREVTRGKLITVFGCGGDRDKTKRPIMGGVAAKYSDFSILTSDNPRSEDPLAILAQIEAGFLGLAGKDRYRVIPDRAEGIRSALTTAKAGDLVIIAGKGHETYQIVGSQTLPFDDRQVACQVLRSEGP